MGSMAKEEAKTASAMIDEKIASLGDWRGETLARVRALIREAPQIEARLLLPDPNDRHVLATAIASGADAIVTFNAQDFPGHILAAEGITRRDPDGFLWELQSRHPEAMAGIVERVRAKAEAISGQPQPLKPLLKRARLYRLGKALGV